MKRFTLGRLGKQLLKSVHLTIAVIWLGSAISMNALRLGWVPVANTDLYSVDHAIAVIDNWVVVPAAMLTLVTGFLESWLTTWGFFRHRWVTVKWVLTAALIVSAPLLVSRWSNVLEAISQVEGLAALKNPDYIQARAWYSITGVSYIASLAFMSVISTLKPWMKPERGRTRA